MEEHHRLRIQNNLEVLLDGTNYDALVAFFGARKDSEVTPEAWIRKWKDMGNNTLKTKKEKKALLFCDIQKRGPKAFDLLVEAILETSGRELAHLLDPAVSLTEPTPEERPLPTVYNKEGEHFLFVDDSWNGLECVEDRNAIKEMFLQLGFKLKTRNELNLPIDKKVASCLVTNFCKFKNGVEVVRDVEWMKEFNERAELTDNTPKILISFRYKQSVSTETDSSYHSTSRHPFVDILWVKVYITRDKANGISSVVQNIIDVCSSDHSLDFRSQLLKVERLCREQKSDPIHVLDDGFDHLFYLKKTDS